MHNHIKDHRPDLPQMVVGMVLNDAGRPLCCELRPGNTADVRSLIPAAKRLRRRFAVRRVCIAADRGMISARTIAELQGADVDFRYILGARMRSVKEVDREVLARAGRYHVVHGSSGRPTDPSPLKVTKELFDRLTAKGWTDVEWGRLKYDLDAVERFRIECSGKTFEIRTDLPGDAGKAFRAVHVSPGPVIRQVAP